VVATLAAGADSGALRNAVDQLKERLKTAVIVLASVDPAGKVLIVAGVTADTVARVKAGELVGSIASAVGGKGGGRPDFAQAGGSDASQLEAALAGVEPFVRTRLIA
jgi:alanyl-tRNA synthetase